MKNIIVIGLNHKIASIDLREKFAFSRGEIENILQELPTNPVVHEAVILSTCNRTEIYSCGVDASCLQTFLYDIVCRKTFVVLDDFLAHHYVLENTAAIEHLMKVACGLDSLILGEPEILGQVKAAYSLACLHKTVGAPLSRLFRYTFQIAKRIRSSTQIGACPVSVASTAVMYAKEWLLPQALSPRILIIGAGDVGAIVAKRAQALTPHPLFVMSRQLKSAQEVAQDIQGIAIDFLQLPEILHQVDIVISATANKEMIIQPEMTDHLKKPLLMLDLAVPRDISPNVSRNKYIHLCQLDQLKTIIQQHGDSRAHAALQAEKLIEENARNFMLSLRTMDSDEVIKQYRTSMEMHCENELQKLLQKNTFEENTALILKDFSRNLLNKIMHLPSVQLRQASVEGRYDVLRSAMEIFGIQEKTK